MRRLIPYLLLLFAIFPLILPDASQRARAETSVLGDPCHLAITAVRPLDGYDLSTLGVASFLNWDVIRPGDVAGNIEHVKVVGVKNVVYASHLASLDTWVPQYPGAVWIIGNEPDAWAQDNLSAEVYAERYYELATKIKNLDNNARVGFAPIVQPSPLRIRYMNRMIARLDDPDLFGSLANALNFIDVFTIHAFILNEELGQWGAGIPPGFENDHADAFVIDAATEISKTHDINILTSWVTAFRQWMKDQGAQGKPLWITEYGSLIPPLDPSGMDYYNVSDEDTRLYMLATFDFIYTAQNPTIGYIPPPDQPGDEYRLVQRAYWYSLNDYRWFYGGSLFDPITRLRTIVGDAYLAYDPPVSQVPQDPYPVSVSFFPMDYTPGSGKTHVDYRVDVRVGNNVTAERLAPVVVNLTLDDHLFAPQAGSLARCGGVGVFSYDWPNIDPSVIHSVHVNVDPDSGLVDTNLNNNTLDLTPTLTLPSRLFLPIIHH